jgi:type IV pilus assembly protein PilB
MGVLSVATEQQVEDILVKDGVLSSSRLREFRARAEDDSEPFFTFLVTNNYVSDEVLTKTIAKARKVPYVNLSTTRISSKVLDLLPKEVAERYMAVPLGEMQKHLVVAMLDADNVQAIDFLSNRIGRPLKVYAASEKGILQVLKQYDAHLGKDVFSSISSIGEARNTIIESDKQQTKSEEKNIKTIVEDSPISKALSAILEFAAKNRASDVHIEPLENSLKIRCRVDGILREIMKLPKSAEPPLISRIKILSNLKIDEHRIPQDGQFSISVLGNSIDLRIAISPVIWGEQVVIRLLDKSGTTLKLEDMGYRGPTLDTIRKGIKRTAGMILTSGPTGSGKTTSLYALLQEVKSDSINIVTLEDPVEYKMDGINQIQVNADVGLTFATGLRSILRQDPDVVMVGEIRDKETAELAVQAALTGHLVFSTLHTNSAAGILPRLLDMNIEPFLIASTVHTVIGQRLVRKISSPSESYQSTVAETKSIHDTIGKLLPEKEEMRAKIQKDLGYENLPLKGDNAYTLFKGRDSSDNPGGYKGRVGIYEAFEVSERIQELILKRSSSSEIQTQAQHEGMIKMREDGYLKAIAGLTSISEVNRVATFDDSGQ